jgi:hypothetical protein
METVNNRRGFIRGLGLFSAFVAGAAGHSALANSSVVDVPQPVDKALAPPDLAMTVQLTGSYGDANVPMDLAPKGTGSIYYINPQNAITNKVDMAVGRDDRLWIKVNDEWRRVALES